MTVLICLCVSQSEEVFHVEHFVLVLMYVCIEVPTFRKRGEKVGHPGILNVAPVGLAETAGPSSALASLRSGRDDSANLFVFRTRIYPGLGCSDIFYSDFAS